MDFSNFLVTSKKCVPAAVQDGVLRKDYRNSETILLDKKEAKKKDYSGLCLLVPSKSEERADDVSD